MDLLDQLLIIFAPPPEDNLLVYCWVWILVVIFLFFCAYLLLSTAKLSDSLETRELESNTNTRPLMDAYKKSFQKFGGEYKTAESAEEYINDYSLLHASLQWNLTENVPSILIGLGILGTFVGLTAGIVGISFDDTDAIQESIQTLLAGMSMAFVTSIWGMGLSIFYSFVLRISHQGIIRGTQELTLHLDSIYKINHWEVAKIRSNEQRETLVQLFDEYLVDEVDGHRQLPKNVFRQLLKESTQQTSSLSNLADDLGRTMEEILETVLASNNDAISRLIEEKLVPVLEDLKGIKEDSSATVIERIVAQLGEGMQAMLDEFKASVAGETKKEMDLLAQRLTDVSQSLLTVPETMKSTTEDVYETLEVMRSLITDSVESSRQQQHEQREEMASAMAAVTESYEATMKAMQADMFKLVDHQRESIERTSALVAQYEQVMSGQKESQRQLQQIVDGSARVITQIDGVAEKLSDNAELISGVSALLESSSVSIQQYLDGFATENRNLIESQRSAIDLTREVLHEHAERFQVIERGLKSVFEELQNGLEEYQVVTADNLNKYLMQFSEAYTAALASTKSSIGQLNESVDELTEVFLQVPKNV